MSAIDPDTDPALRVFRSVMETLDESLGCSKYDGIDLCCWWNPQHPPCAPCVDARRGIENAVNAVLQDQANQLIPYVQHKRGCPANEPTTTPQTITATPCECACGLADLTARWGK